MARDYYEVLGVSRDADAEELQQAFRRLARVNHPDVNRDPAAEERFKEINEAYSALSDPELRKRYDRFGDDYRRVPDDWEERVGAGGARPGRGGYGGFGGGGFGGGGRRYTWSSDDIGGDVGGGFGGVDIEDLLGGMFGGGRGGRGRPVAGADQEAELELTVEEAYRGGRREITLNGPDGPRAYTVTSRPASPTASASGSRARAARGWAAGRRETSTSSCTSARTRVTGSRARTSPSPCRWRPGRPRSARPSPSSRPAGSERSPSHPVAPPVAGCGCAGRACPTGEAATATSTQRWRSGCRRA